MEKPNTLAYCTTATITAVKSFIVPAQVKQSHTGLQNETADVTDIDVVIVVELELLSVVVVVDTAVALADAIGGKAGNSGRKLDGALVSNKSVITRPIPNLYPYTMSLFEYNNHAC